MQRNINILNELREAGAVALLDADNKNYFSVPDGYFDDLQQIIFANVFVRSLPSSNPFTVPGGYFENLPGIILDKINFNNATESTGIKNVYAVPEGYFNSFADSILKKIKSTPQNPVQQELEEISPLLGSIPRTNIFTIPENYFPQLDPLNKVEEKAKPAKVISLGSRTRKWINYAAAACISAVLFGGGYVYFSGDKGKSITNVTDSSIAASSKINVQQAISGLSDSEIENYLSENSNMAVFTNVGMDEGQQQTLDLQHLMKNISDEEIQEYLKEENAAADNKDGGI